jgi:hypothetical protein
VTLDGAKTGMTVLKEDTRKYQKFPPTWKERHVMHGKNGTNLKRPSSLGRFIMDDLHLKLRWKGMCGLPGSKPKIELNLMMT